MFSSWIISVFASTLICIISEFFVSGSKFNKIIKSIISVFFLINLLIIFKNFKIPKFNYFIKEYNQEIENRYENKFENKFENRIRKFAKAKIKEKISDFLHKRGIKESEIRVYIDKNSNTYCKILFKNGVDDKQDLIKELKSEFKIDFYLIN